MGLQRNLLKPIRSRVGNGATEPGAVGDRIEQARSIAEAGMATKAMLPLFPIMPAVTLMLQVRSFPAMVMVFLTSPARSDWRGANADSVRAS